MDTPAAQDTLQTHARFVRALAEALLRDPHEADDLAQEVWLAWLRQPANSVVSVRGWLARATRNLATNRRRARARRAQHEAHGAGEEPARAPDEEVAERELLHRLIDGVYALEEPYRGTLLARYFRGLDARALAAERGLPLATVRSHERRALEQLRGRLERTHGNRAWAAVLLRFVMPRRAVPASLALAGGLVFMSGVAVLWWRGGTDAELEAASGVTLNAPDAQPAPTSVAEAPPMQAVRESLVTDNLTVPPEPEPPEAHETSGSAGLGSLLVRVREVDGRPIVAATVRVEVTPEDREHLHAPENESETSIEGEVLLREVVAGVRLVVEVDPDASEVNDERRSGAVCGDRLALEYECMQPLVLRAGTRRTLEVVLPPLHTVQGRVLDPQGAALPYARVEPCSRVDGSEPFRTLGSSIRTDSDGTFELSFRAQDPTKPVFLTAGAQGPLHTVGRSPNGTPSTISTFEWSARRALAPEELAGARAVELHLAAHPKAVLVAEIVEPDGSPSSLLAGQVEFSRADGSSHTNSVYATCPPGGLFGFDFEPGEYRIEVARSHGTPEQALFRRTDPIPADGQTHVATLLDASEVVVRLRGEALAEVIVTRFFLAPEDVPARVQPDRISTQAPWLESSATLRTPELRGTGLTVVRTVRGSEARLVLGPPGYYRLGVRRHGYVPLASELLTLGPGEHGFTLATPAPHAWIGGRLRADPGQAFHALELCDEKGRALTLPSRQTLPDPLQYLALPASGVFALDPLAPGRYLLRLGPIDVLRQGRATLEVPLVLQAGENPPLDLSY